MNVRVVKVDLSGVEQQLERIANMLEQLVYTTNPPAQAFEFDDTPEKRVFYSSDAEEIVRHKLTQMGRTYKPRT